MEDSYPELDNRRHILGEAYERLEQVYEADETVLTLEDPHIEAIGSALDFNRAKTYAKFNDLIQEGCLRARLSPGPFGSYRTLHAFITVESLTDRGLLEIGAIPDPRQRLIQGLEGAMREIEEDSTLDEQEKGKRINLGREALAFVRGLSVELAARVITGELPPR